MTVLTQPSSCCGMGLLAAPGLWIPPSHGVVVGRLSVEADLSRHAVFEPTSIAPDVAVGLGDRIGVAMLTSHASQLGVGAGSGVCVQGAHETLGTAPAVCEEQLSNLEAAVQMRDGHGVFGSAGVLMRNPTAYSIDLAAGIELHALGMWCVIAPAVILAVSGRYEGNGDRAEVAVYVGRDVGPGELHIHTGLEGAFATFTETVAIPLGVGGSIGHDLRLGADVTLDRALGPLNGQAWRSASVYIETRFGGGR